MLVAAKKRSSHIVLQWPLLLNFCCQVLGDIIYYMVIFKFDHMTSPMFSKDFDCLCLPSGTVELTLLHISLII